MKSVIENIFGGLIEPLIEAIGPVLFNNFTKGIMYIIYTIFIEFPKSILEQWENIITGFENFNLLDSVFVNETARDGTGFKMSPLLIFFIAIAMIVMVIILISNFISSQIAAELLTMRQKIKESLKNSIKASALVIALPVMFFTFKFFISIFQDILRYGLNYFNNLEKHKNLVEVIHDSGWLINKKGKPEIADLSQNYNIVLPTIGFVVLGMTLTKITTVLTVRIFKLLFLYMMAPFAASKIVSDGGRAFYFWKEEIMNNFIIALLLNLSIMITKTGIFLLLDYINRVEMFEKTLMIVKSLFKLGIIFGGLQFITISQDYMKTLIENSSQPNSKTNSSSPRKALQNKLTKTKESFMTKKDNIFGNKNPLQKKPQDLLSFTKPSQNGVVLQKLQMASKVGPPPLKYTTTAINIGSKGLGIFIDRPQKK